MNGQFDKDDTRFLINVLDELREQTDRGVAIIGGSYVENSLERFLKAVWRSESDGADEKKALPEVFSPSGPLGPFSVKIKISFLSRLTGRTAFKNLDNIKEIRNAFAHRLVWDRETTKHERLSFKTASIRDRCKNLLILPHVANAMKDAQPIHGVPIEQSDARSRYIIACIQWSLVFNWSPNDPTPLTKRLLG